MICDCFTDLNIIKERGCFARQKTSLDADIRIRQKNRRTGIDAEVKSKRKNIVTYELRFKD